MKCTLLHIFIGFIQFYSLQSCYPQVFKTVQPFIFKHWVSSFSCFQFFHVALRHSFSKNLIFPYHLLQQTLFWLLSRCSKMEYLKIKHQNLWTYYLVVISQLHLGLLSFSFSCQHEQGLVVHTSSSYPYHLSYLPQNLHQQSDSGPVKS